MAHRLPKLPYGYDALEPYIDARTMEIHHTKHHASYVDNLNKLLSGHSALLDLDLKEIIHDISKVPADIRQAVRNNGGGHLNHSLFWQIMGPGAGGKPSGPIGGAIATEFGGFDMFKTRFGEIATKRFGSGWAWLCVNPRGRLELLSTPNQDSPVMQGLTPVLGLDVWEHAYYLKYQNRRADYINAWWRVVNWAKVGEFYARCQQTVSKVGAVTS